MYYSVHPDLTRMLNLGNDSAARAPTVKMPKNECKTSPQTQSRDVDETIMINKP